MDRPGTVGLSDADTTGARSAKRHAQRVERAKAIRTELGGRPVLDDPLPDRPKGMHRATYERLRQELLEIERAEDERIDEALRSGELSVLDYFADVLRSNLRDR